MEGREERKAGRRERERSGNRGLEETRGSNVGIGVDGMNGMVTKA